jgi:hypothetical protein
LGFGGSELGRVGRLSLSQHEYDVAIVSAFGRGELLARELKTRGLKVALMDVSEALGNRNLADLEGPFPVARPNPLLPSHLEWLMSHSFDEIPNGLSVWLPSGPVEFRGPLADFYASARPEVAFFREYFPGGAQPSVKRTDISGKLNELRFEEKWVTEFAHGFCSNEFSASTDCHVNGEAFPLGQMVQSPIFRSDRIEENRAELESTGIRWIKAEKMGEMEVERGRLVGLSHQDELLRCEQMIWCLSSEETFSISRALGRQLFPRGVTSSRWAWRRFQVHSPKNSLDFIVPPYVVLIDDIYFPWAYENLMVLKRRKPGLSDVWVRLPSENSRKPDQLKKFTKKLEEKLRARFRGLAHEVEPFWDEGPPLFPVFEPEQLRSFVKPPFANLTFEGPEVLPRQDWAGRFQGQVATLMAIVTKKKKEKEKEKSDDLALHAP